MATEFKSQICTTVEQSDRLLDLGLKPETADMHYLWAGYWHLSLEPWEHAVDDYPFDFHSEEEQEDWKLRHRPAWSLHRLIEMIAGGSEEQMIFLPDPYDEIIEEIAGAIMVNSFNKEYLCEK
jgi:hypothetical protein